ncbi:NB-ARC [Arabidopsis thaliana x Arabidopsis arenosa]|uniref:NB-ARC n=1 Tax=Arabidopsis thaliana x Arabidopsis arenosa TaxID=1240361 RepID=A0A8T1XET3_9BRAS|nr:NB-ARC [Arabidopsis thaliana x Arabidopsis arenosa]
MPSKTPQQAVLTNEFTTTFNKNCEDWLKINGLAVGTLEKKRDENEEEERLKTECKLPDHDIHGFDNEIKSLQHFLLDQKVNREFKSLVIVGEYGVGKTALCQKIFNDKAVKSVYAPRVWVSMENKESKDKLDGKICVLKKILTGLGVKHSILETISADAKQEFKDNAEVASNQEAGEIDRETEKEKELSALLYALHLNLRWKKYLIVFDDVRENDNWDEKLDVKLNEDEKWGKFLSDGFPKGSGGRVIYTTRYENLAKKLVSQEHEIHRLWPLSDHQSVWKIYDAVIQKREKESPRNDKKCIDELMNKSRGLPLAARLLAELEPVFVDDEIPTGGSIHGQPDASNSQTANQTSS